MIRQSTEPRKVEVTKTPPCPPHECLDDLELQLDLLLTELEEARTGAAPLSSEPDDENWQSTMDSFFVKSTTIRRMLGQFYHSDLPTRRYMRHYLDEEFDKLKEAYDSLSTQFGDKDRSQPN